MKNVIIKIPFILLMIWPYVFFLGMIFPSDSFFGIYCVLTLLICALNIFHACSYIGENTARELGLWGMVIKLIHMPFYVLAMLLMIVVIVSVVTSSFRVPPIIVILALGSLLFMITSSSYCAKATMAAKDMGIMKKDTAMMLSISSFIFIGDVICSILIYSKIKKNKKIKTA